MLSQNFFEPLIRPRSGMNQAPAIVEAAEDRLRRSSYLELRRVACSYYDGVLTVEGHVSSYYLRQMAQTTLKGLPHVRAIDNQLEVVSGGVKRGIA